MKKILIIAAAAVLCGCATQKRVYKVTFAGGEYEYFELDYKPKAGATSIVYEGDTILGVKTIEQVK